MSAQTRSTGADPPGLGSRGAALVWSRAHGVSAAQVALVVVAWFASAASCRWSLPRVAPGVEPQPVDLQVVGLVTMSIAAGLTTLFGHDSAAWLTATAARSAVALRAAWSGTVLVATLAVAGLSVVLLPGGLPPVRGYLSVGLIWWSVGVVGAVLGGTMAGLLGPLTLGVLATSRLVPWRLNLVFHPGMGDERLIVAAVGVGVAVTLYSVRGPPADRS